MRIGNRLAAALCALAALAPGALWADTLGRLAAGEPLRIGVRADTRPLSFVVDGAARGYTVALCERVAEALAAPVGRPVAVAHVVVTAENRFDALAEGRIDMLCGAASITLSRRERVAFSIPVYVDGAVAMVRRDAAVDLTGLSGRRVGVRAGTTTERGLRATLERDRVAAEVVTFADHGEGLDGLLAGELAAYFADQSIAAFMIGASPRGGELAIIDQLLTIEQQAIGLPRGDEAFRAEVDRALSRMYRSGEVERLFAENFAPASMGDLMAALVLLAPLPD